MKKIDIKNFGGLPYLTLCNVPIRESEFGDILAVEPCELERLAARSIVENFIPIRGVEFRIIKSALAISNEALGELIGVSRNTVLKWGKNLDQRLPQASEMLLRLLVAEKLDVKISCSIEQLGQSNVLSELLVKAAS
jgi:DNA-binding transcriptional regulator YiaG